MAATTFTSTDGITRVAPLPHTGVAVWTAKYTRVQTTTLSTSDEVLMMKVPNHITIVNALIRADTKSSTSGVFKVGVAGTDNNIIGTFSGSDGGVTVNGATVLPNGPVTVSLSDSGENVWTWVKLTCNSGATTTSASVSFALTIFYTRSGNVIG